ncbi:MAG: response regulator transcription factor [Planctomycetota bacterium]|nr:response regulator transcription factor [Planctomycetota bacterium]MDA1223168.1 response regulator transcription factor [Planctomycetota bacterium]
MSTTETMSTKILVVEDEPDLREGLRHNLELDGFEVAVAADGPSGLRAARDGEFELVLLDLMLPGMSGSEVLNELRKSKSELPVIIVTAKDADRDKIRGLDLGADDYVTKPFVLEELTARIRAVLRRTARPAKETDRELWEFPGLTVDFRRFTATRDGIEHQLSKFEADILKMLIDHRGEVVTRRDLLEKVWGYVHVPATRTVDNHVARLRKKIEEDIDAPRHVITVHGLGYRFDSEPVQ